MVILNNIEFWIVLIQVIYCEISTQDRPLLADIRNIDTEVQINGADTNNNNFANLSPDLFYQIHNLHSSHQFSYLAYFLYSYFFYFKKKGEYKKYCIHFSLSFIEKLFYPCPEYVIYICKNWKVAWAFFIFSFTNKNQIILKTNLLSTKCKNYKY